MNENISDRELLEMAAKAVGIKHPGGEHCVNGPAVWDCVKLKWWRPLTDDSDALRLAVAIGMNIEIEVDQAGFTCASAVDYSNAVLIEYHNNNPMDATRRAIVRAAAEIGRSMP